jgi:ArsR family transcriptional regulator
MGQPIGDEVFESAAELFGLLSAPTRLRIVCLLLEGERNVSQMLERIGVSQPNISQHLGTLYRAGIVGRRRTGAQVFYRVTHEPVRRLCRTLSEQRLLIAPGRSARSVRSA